jgi:hypothetical protein
MEVEFRQLFSEKWGADAAEFERRLFRKCLFRHALPFASLIEKLDPDFFREDYEMLRDVASARTTEEVICELNRFFGRNARDRSFWRPTFYLRISGKRVLNVYRSLTRQKRDEMRKDKDGGTVAETVGVV